MYLVFTRVPGENYRRRLGSSLLYLCNVFRALINSIVCWFCTSALGLVLFQIRDKDFLRKEEEGKENEPVSSGHGYGWGVPYFFAANTVAVSFEAGSVDQGQFQSAACSRCWRFLLSCQWVIVREDFISYLGLLTAELVSWLTARFYTLWVNGVQRYSKNWVREVLKQTHTHTHTHVHERVQF